MASQGSLERVPPHDYDAEKAVLSAMLLNDKAIFTVRQNLRADDFYDPANKLIYEAILSLTHSGYKADLLTLRGELERAGKVNEARGMDYVASLTNLLPSSANVDYYAERVQDCSLRRGLIQAAGKAGTRAFDETTGAKQILEEIQEQLFTLSDTRGLFNYKEAKESIGAAFSFMSKVFDNKGNYTGVPSGFDALDRRTSGFQPGELVIIGARPSLGKTTLALNMAVHAALRKKIPAAFFSLEMPDRDLMLRIFSSEAKVDLGKLRTGKFDAKEKAAMFRVAEKLKDAPLYFVDMPRMTMLDIQAMARMLRTEKKIEIIFIDYIGLISSDNPKLARYELISEVSRNLKGMARELGIPVIALSQLRREAEKEKQPNLADIRDSGSIEQDADVVMFITRERGEEKDFDDQDPIQQVKLTISKNRNGPVGYILLTLFKNLTRFESISKDKG
jgi:replicative DNA helicase